MATTGRPCKICTSPFRNKVEKKLKSGESPLKIAKWLKIQKVEISQTSIRRHMTKHMVDEEEKEKIAENESAPTNDNIKEKINEIRNQLNLKSNTPQSLEATNNTLLLKIHSDLLEITAANLSLYKEGLVKFPDQPLKAIKQINELYSQAKNDQTAVESMLDRSNSNPVITRDRIKEIKFFFLNEFYKSPGANYSKAAAKTDKKLKILKHEVYVLEGSLQELKLLRETGRDNSLNQLNLSEHSAYSIFNFALSEIKSGRPIMPEIENIYRKQLEILDSDTGQADIEAKKAELELYLEEIKEEQELSNTCNNMTDKINFIVAETIKRLDSITQKDKCSSGDEIQELLNIIKAATGAKKLHEQTSTKALPLTTEQKQKIEMAKEIKRESERISIKSELAHLSDKELDAQLNRYGQGAGGGIVPFSD